MTEYTDKKAAIEAILQAVIKGYGTDYGVIDSDVIYEILDNLPAADVAPVVRCKDCKYFRPLHGCLHGNGMVMARSDGYCSYSERKE